jgi:hypothetical protein
MLTRTVPEAYDGWMEAAVKRAVEEIEIDIFRRATGEKPSIPDVFLNPEKTGDLVVLVGVLGDSLVAGIEVARAERAKAHQLRQIATVRRA